MEQFLQRCFYHSGQYNSEDDFAELDKKLKLKEVCACLKLLLLRLSYLNFSSSVSLNM